MPAPAQQSLATAQPLIELSKELARACESGTVLVANHAQKRHLLDAFNSRQLAAGRSAWRTPRIDRIDDWLAMQYRRLRRAGHPAAHPKLLEPAAERWLWLTRAPESLSAVRAADLYPLVQQAWATVHDHGLESRIADFGDNENTRLFRRWAQRFRAAAAGTWMTSAELKDVLARALPTADLSRPDTQLLMIAGIEATSPALTRLSRALSDAGVEVAFHTPTSVATSHIDQLRCEDADAELARASAWARDVWRAADEPVAIGIVVPDPISRYDAIVRQLDATLAPHRIDDEPLTRPYNVAGGIRLSAHPCVGTALAYLEWLQRPVSHDRARALLASPFLAFEHHPTPIPARLPESFTFATLAGATSARAHPQHPLHDALRPLATAPHHTSLDAWMEHFRGCLGAAGWPGSTQDSLLHQAAAEFDDVLDATRRLAALTGALDGREALELIVRQADDRLFAPKRPAAPIQVVGIDDAPLLRFTHLWVTGLTERDWPGPASANPLLPLRLQREAGVPRCDAEAQHAYARARLARWRGATAHLVLSAAARDGDETLAPTPLLSAAWRPATSDVKGHPFFAAARSAGSMIALETVEDDGVPVAAPGATRGSAALRDQARCPFRAFAIQRLRAAPVDCPHTLPDARERGILVHEALRLVYAELPDRDALRALSPAHREALAQRAADAAVAAWKDRFPERIRVTEATRAAARLAAWLAADAHRPPFRVVARELEVDATIGGLALELRIDRVDEVPSGRVVIDYKTGPVDIGDWTPEELLEVQLPLYAGALEGVAAVVYAQLTPERAELSGVAAAPEQLTEPATGDAGRIVDPGQFRFPDWPALRDAWGRELDALARAFCAGDARVAPRNAAVCDSCHLQSVCRIGMRHRDG